MLVQVNVEEVALRANTVHQQVEAAQLIEPHVAVVVFAKVRKLDLLVSEVLALVVAQLVVFNLVLSVLVVDRGYVVVCHVATLLLAMFGFVCTLFEQLLVSQFFLLLRDASAHFLCGKIIRKPKSALGVGCQTAPDCAFVLRHWCFVARPLFIYVPFDLVLLIYCSLVKSLWAYLTSCPR